MFMASHTQTTALFTEESVRKNKTAPDGCSEFKEGENST